MDKTTKMIAAITGLLVAVGALVASLGLGGGDAPAGITVILDSPESFEVFLRNPPGSRVTVTPFCYTFDPGINAGVFAMSRGMAETAPAMVYGPNRNQTVGV